MTKTTHPTTIPIIADALALSPLRLGDSVGNDVGDKEYSQLQSIEEEPESLVLYQTPVYDIYTQTL